jgi:hypothetical protein
MDSLQNIAAMSILTRADERKLSCLPPKLQKHISELYFQNCFENFADEMDEMIASVEDPDSSPVDVNHFNHEVKKFTMVVQSNGCFGIQSSEEDLRTIIARDGG